MSRKIILSSGNEHKVKEIKKILEEFNIEIITKNEIGLKDFDVVEDADTLEGNAFKKAEELSKLVDGIVLADDTGLFVDALDGEPGVFSARYAGEGSNDEKNRLLLLEKLKNVPMEKRTAYFKTVIALVLEDGSKYKTEGICNGRIAFEPNGNNGFGYDTLFIVEGLDKSFGEMTDKEKNSLSHRANALKNLKHILGELLN
ncbi:RdgB/HAM1 family non-canonical purine NTP pyrophosphatase [Sedimentibacter sp. zth1]|uniref:RdgB/HAM1 family non-canonical purine NTP pyrophosphatase n=1 Tax=Sedimentibacter sp. zth1 TaxID=2816908 RepID=UPI001A910630|nr:RdgB/HAM1 family non-canonical purine NTP pyrophosphatase [Sedimentibacter sp. zth1]QSX05072.1 RdgB/HAM1 family non-canonical purine NTP pyrophosphatase [Sedimentibacter sp. zth1]